MSLLCVRGKLSVWDLLIFFSFIVIALSHFYCVYVLLEIACDIKLKCGLFETGSRNR